MKTGKILLIILFFHCTLSTTMLAQEASSKIGESQRFEFFSNYWFNLHHLLYQEALVQQTADKSALGDEDLKEMSTTEKQQFDKAVAYYKDHLLKEDLRMSDYMWEFKQWITSSQNGNALTDIPGKFKPHCTELIEVSDVYDQFFWSRHNAMNQSTLESNLANIKTIENGVVDQLGQLTREAWQDNKIRVDITYFAKATPRNLRDRPYTSLYPTHIVMNSKASNILPGNWLELLFHEASHHLIGSRSGFVGGTIEDVASTLSVESPNSLWHAYLFYFSGMTVKEAIKELEMADYELYMKRNRVFGNYIPSLDKYLLEYMDGKISLAEATQQIINSIK